MRLLVNRTIPAELSSQVNQITYNNDKADIKVMTCSLKKLKDSNICENNNFST